MAHPIRHVRRGRILTTNVLTLVPMLSLEFTCRLKSTCSAAGESLSDSSRGFSPNASGIAHLLCIAKCITVVSC